jgi:hydrogenase nickel incorporation protein HypA/HybF
LHELGLCEGILDAVERRAAGREVVGVKVRVGEALRVVEPALEQSFTLVSEGTVAEGARIEMVEVDGDELLLESITLKRPEV